MNDRNDPPKRDALDALLDADTPPFAMPPGLRARLIASGRETAGRRSALTPPRWTRAASVALALAAGAAAGYAGAAAAFSPAGADALLGYALAAPSDPFAAFVEDDA